jgi:hypothetical protein
MLLEEALGTGPPEQAMKAVPAREVMVPAQGVATDLVQVEAPRALVLQVMDPEAEEVTHLVRLRAPTVLVQEVSVLVQAEAMVLVPEDMGLAAPVRRELEAAMAQAAGRATAPAADMTCLRNLIRMVPKRY